MQLELARLSDIPVADLVALLNDAEVRRHMPLSSENNTAETAREWAAAKDAQWAENGYGPWAIRIDGRFAGWGGFQKEGEDADLGIVLLAEYWGHGNAIHGAMLKKGFAEFGFDSVTILLPPSRVRLKSLARLGYRADGEIEYAGHRFLKFRLARPK
jgi:RimJ/RimL family protein N-acetyltransferase